MKTTLSLLLLLTLPSLLCAQIGEVAWTVIAGDTIYSSPSTDGNGTIFTGSEDGLLYAYTTEGTLSWAYQTGDMIQSSAAVGDDGTVYFGSWDNYLYAVRDGELVWKVETGTYITATPAIAHDGTIYIGSNDGIFYAVSPEGQIEWFYTTDAPIYATATIAADGSIYFANENGEVFALTSEGEELWQFSAEEINERNNRIRSAPSIGADGTVYIGSGNWKLYALHGTTGVPIWSFEAGDAIDSSPVIDTEGRLYFGARDGFYYCLNQSGALEWFLNVGDVFYSSPAIDTNGTTYLAAYEGFGITRLRAIDGEGKVLWSTGFEGFNDSSPLIYEEALYIGMYDGQLHRVDIGANAADSAWPMFAQGLQRRSAVETTFGGFPVVDGWIDSWFGWMQPRSDNYYWHTEHGWIYLLSLNGNSFWYWDFDLQNWLWTSESFYPILWHNTEGWIWYQQGSVAPERWYFSYSAMDWVQL